jgi:hypothetical protein
MSRKRDPEVYLTRYRAKRPTEHKRQALVADRLWSPVEAAEFLGVPVTTLQKWRYLREGPESFKVGRHVRYDPDAVRRWLVEECGQERSA